MMRQLHHKTDIEDVIMQNMHDNMRNPSLLRTSCSLIRLLGGLVQQNELSETVPAHLTTA